MRRKHTSQVFHAINAAGREFHIPKRAAFEIDRLRVAGPHNDVRETVRNARRAAAGNSRLVGLVNCPQLGMPQYVVEATTDWCV